MLNIGFEVKLKATVVAEVAIGGKGWYRSSSILYSFGAGGATAMTLCVCVCVTVCVNEYVFVC